MKPFLLIQSRPENAASDNEYDAFLGFSKLSPHNLQRIRAEAGDLPEMRLSDYSGIILGGGPNNVTDPHSKKGLGQKQLEQRLDKLLDDIIKNDFPFLGACYGIGLLTNHQRGVMSRRYHEPVGPLSIELTSLGASDDLLRGLPKKFEAFGGHKEACETLPKSATLLATSRDCPVQMFRIKQNVYAVQFHPELDSLGLETRINVYKNAGYFPPETAAKLIAEGYAAAVSQPGKILENFTRKYA